MVAGYRDNASLYKTNSNPLFLYSLLFASYQSILCIQTSFACVVVVTR